MELGGQSISYASYQNKQINNQEKEFVIKITSYETSLHENNVRELKKSNSMI